LFVLFATAVPVLQIVRPVWAPRWETERTRKTNRCELSTELGFGFAHLWADAGCSHCRRIIL